MKFGSLFSGIGGMDLGLERAGMECAWQIELNDYASKVLAKHWPDVRRFGDIRAVDTRELERVDLVAGGFPCQDVSTAGKRVGIDGERSGLWSEFLRIIRELQPRYVLVENVTGLLIRGMDRVLGELAASGYDAEWSCLPASTFGAPHHRPRIFIVAYPTGERERPIMWWRRFESESAQAWHSGFWSGQSEPDRISYGIPSRVDRLTGLGNAVVPQVAEWIGRRILESDVELTA